MSRSRAQNVSRSWYAVRDCWTRVAGRLSKFNLLTRCATLWSGQRESTKSLLRALASASVFHPPAHTIPRHQFCSSVHLVGAELSPPSASTARASREYAPSVQTRLPAPPKG